MTKKLTKQQVVDFAKSQGINLVGVANIERFKDAPPRMRPASILPEAKSVIVLVRQILRGNWRGIEEGTHWPAYTYFGYHGLLNSFFIPVGVYETTCFIEDHGWEAVPYYPGVPEGQPPDPPLRPGAVAPNVHLAIRIAGVAAGVGEIGWSKVFLTKEFGPRQRLAAIITDLELEPDPLLEPCTLCTRCMNCLKGCPSDAIPHVKENKRVKIKIEDKEYEWADVDMGRCTLSYHGGDPRVSPFLHKTFPGYNFDVSQQHVSEDDAYKLCWPLSLGTWRRTPNDPSGQLVEGHSQIARWGSAGSYGIGGSRGCMRSCSHYMESHDKCIRKYVRGPFIKRPRWMLSHQVPTKEEQAQFQK